ncbi:hypothetical protein [Micromonospora sp. NPDC048898]|uniref:hypothetical protein n=1 Tax=Micromonospora sp. NPDC048898 TaxID=3364260 RepID=UPI0037142ACE
MSTPPPAAEPPGELSSEQRARLLRLFEREFGAAWRATVAAGANPATLADATADQVREMCSRAAVGDDKQHLVDDPPDGPVVGEQD